MAALKSKTELFHWYNELKNEFKTGKITVVAFEHDVVNNIFMLTEGDKKPSATKLSLVADILNSVVFDHIFTMKAFGDIAAMLTTGEPARTAAVIEAHTNFNAIQTQARLRNLDKEKEQAVKPEEKKVFAKFPTKAELEQWVSIKKPAPRAVTEPFNMSLMSTGDQSTVNFFDDVEKHLVSMKLGLDHDDPNYVSNMLILDYFVSLISTLEIPERSYQHLVEELMSLYADPVKTPYIDAFVERGQQPIPTQPKQPTTAQRVIDRAATWRENEIKAGYEQNGILQQFADNYCPVMAAKQHATRQLHDFVAGAVKRVLTAIAYPNNPADAELLAKGFGVEVLNVKHGAIGVSTTISRNGLVKLRIFAEREQHEIKRGLSVPFDNNRHHMRSAPMGTPMPALVDGFIHLWDIPNQVPRHAHNGVGAMLGNPYPLHQLDGLMQAIAQETLEYGITPTYGSTEDSIIVVLH